MMVARRVAMLLMCVMVMLSASAEAKLPTPCVVDGVTRQSAKDYCDTTPLDDLEGVWSFPDDGLLLLIVKSADVADIETIVHYQIIVVEAADQSLRPGQVVGYIALTPDDDMYRMWMYSEIKGLTLIRPVECSAKLVDDGYGLIVASKEHHIKINPLGLLPNFWRVARLQSTDPVSKIPKGFLKVYPSYDGNGSYRRFPRYL